MRNEHDASRLSLADRADNGVHILWQASRIVGRRKSHGDGLVTALLEPQRRQMPIPCAATRAGDQDKADARHSDRRLTMKLRGRAEVSEGRRRHAEVSAADHLRLRCTMNAATMMMKTAMKVAERMYYSKPLAAPNRWRFTDRSSEC